MRFSAIRQAPMTMAKNARAIRERVSGALMFQCLRAQAARTVAHGKRAIDGGRAAG